jgi:hypothetical protein
MQDAKQLFGALCQCEIDAPKQARAGRGFFATLTIACDGIFFQRCAVGIVDRSLSGHYARCRTACDAFCTDVFGNYCFVIVARDNLHYILSLTRSEPS